MPSFTPSSVSRYPGLPSNVEPARSRRPSRAAGPSRPPPPAACTCSPKSPTLCPAPRSSGSPTGTAAPATVQLCSYSSVSIPAKNSKRQEERRPRPHRRPARPFFAVLLASPFRHNVSPPPIPSPPPLPPAPGTVALATARTAAMRSRARSIFDPSARSISPRISAPGSPHPSPPGSGD